MDTQHQGAPPPQTRPRQSGAISRAEYQAIVAKLDAIPAMACPNFRLLSQQHPK